MVIVYPQIMTKDCTIKVEQFSSTFKTTQTVVKTAHLNSLAKISSEITMHLSKVELFLSIARCILKNQLIQYSFSTTQQGSIIIRYRVMLVQLKSFMEKRFLSIVA